MIFDISINKPDQHHSTENTRVAVLINEDNVVTDTEEKTNIISRQFQSVFTNETSRQR